MPKSWGNNGPGFKNIGFPFGGPGPFPSGPNKIRIKRNPSLGNLAIFPSPRWVAGAGFPRAQNHPQKRSKNLPDPRPTLTFPSHPKSNQPFRGDGKRKKEKEWAPSEGNQKRWGRRVFGGDLGGGAPGGFFPGSPRLWASISSGGFSLDPKFFPGVFNFMESAYHLNPKFFTSNFIHAKTFWGNKPHFALFGIFPQAPPKKNKPCVGWGLTGGNGKIFHAP